MLRRAPLFVHRPHEPVHLCCTVSGTPRCIGVQHWHSSRVGGLVQRTPSWVFVQAYKRVQSERRKKAVFQSIWGTPRARLASVSSVIASKRASIIGDAASVQLAMRSSPNQAAGWVSRIV